ncbi:MAG: ABC transporter substrate-binding protein [Deltaproteobacteria bacterium]|nr:ABC transporter substrate-binding protein [Deltaproteobacteria bacterium]
MKLGSRKVTAFSVYVAIALALNAGVAGSDTLQDARKEGTVVFYSTMNAGHQDILVKAFNKKYPFMKVESFRGNTATVTHRFLTEASTGSNLADVAGVDALNGWVFRDKDLLQPYKSREAEAFPAEFRDAEGFLLCCTYVLTSVIAYNTRRVPAGDVPRTHDDLLLPKWRKRLGMNSDMAESFAGRIKVWGKEKTVNYFRALMKQEPSLRRGRSLLLQLLAVGEFDAVVDVFGYRVLELRDQGMPIDLVHADPVLAWPWHLVLAKRAPHPNAGKLFIDYVLSEEGQRLIGSLGRPVVRPRVKGKYPRLVDGIKLYPVKPEIAKDFEENSRLFRSIVK